MQMRACIYIYPRYFFQRPLISSSDIETLCLVIKCGLVTAKRDEWWLPRDARPKTRA